MQDLQNRFVDKGEYENKRDKLLGFLNSILGKAYSFGPDGLPIETIFDETFNEKISPNSDKICNAGKKAYAYYLKEVLQKLNLLNQHILKGQAALNALQTCTNEDQIENYKTILQTQDGLVKKYLDDFNNYTVVQTLNTTRTTQRYTITNEKFEKKENSVEINYATRGKIWNEDGNEEIDFQDELDALNSMEALRMLETIKEVGTQEIITTLKNKHSEEMTNLNDEFGFNVVEKNTNTIPSNSSPIALFDELTLLEKLKYIHVYYHNRDDYPYEFYHYPKDLKSGVPCMSRDELLDYVNDTNNNENNNDELVSLGIMPSEANKPKADLVEPGAIELFYIGYLKDSMGAINALAAFMEIKSVSLMAQIEQQSYRIKALKAYLQMLEFGLQSLNTHFNEDKQISQQAYLALKYAAANQTRALANINGEDYIVLQDDRDVKYNYHNLSDNNAYIYVKATPEGINEFLNMQYNDVDLVFHQKTNNNSSFSSLSWEEVKQADANNTKFGGGPDFYNNLSNYGYNYLHKEVSIGGYWVVKDDGETYRYRASSKSYLRYLSTTTIESSEINEETHKMVINEPKANGTVYNYIYYHKEVIIQPKILTSTTGNILFAEFDDEAEAIEHLPKELETAKTKIDDLLKKPYTSGVDFSWDNRNLGENNKNKSAWDKFVAAWQNTCQTAIENVGSQIDSVNKTIKSLRSKIDTFDSSANRFRDKFYSTTMTLLNKLS
ncbi:MAG: hypothetical protein ACLRFH_00440 [Opitutales bacterium]